MSALKWGWRGDMALAPSSGVHTAWDSRKELLLGFTPIHLLEVGQEPSDCKATSSSIKGVHCTQDPFNSLSDDELDEDEDEDEGSHPKYELDTGVASYMDLQPVDDDE